MNNFHRGLLDEATYQISKIWAFQFQIRIFFKFSVKTCIFSSCDLDVQWHSCEVWSKYNQWFRRRCHLKKLFADGQTDAQWKTDKM